MVTKTYLPFNLLDRSGNSDSNNYYDSSDSSDSSTQKTFLTIFSFFLFLNKFMIRTKIKSLF